MLDQLTNWLREQIQKFWQALQDLLGDLFVMWLKHSIEMIVWTIAHIPVPAFLQQESLGTILGRAGPTIGWFVATFQIGPSLGVIATAMVFYIVRRFLTLGIW